MDVVLERFGQALAFLSQLDGREGGGGVDVYINNVHEDLQRGRPGHWVVKWQLDKLNVSA